MRYEEIEEFLYKFTKTELKQLKLITDHFKFCTIEETIENLPTLDNFSFLTPLTFENYNLELKEPPQVFSTSVNLNPNKINTDNKSSKPNFIYFNKNSRFKEVGTHKHNFIEISYMFSGECTQIINGKKIHLKKGDLVILDTNVSHSIEFTKANDIMINFLMLKNYFNATFFKHLDSNGLMSNFLLNALNEKKDTNDYIIFHTKNNDEIRTLIKKIIFELTEDNLCSHSMIDCCFIMLFTELLRIYESEDSNFEYESDDEVSLKLSRILHYIEDNYKDITLASVAEHFHFSPKYFSAMIKKATGKNFTDIILDQRLINSSLLLKNTTMSIEDICNNTGFSNSNFFYKKFKTHYAMTPSEYRKKHQNCL